MVSACIYVNHKMSIVSKLLNIYCEIFGNRSYGRDALASLCVFVPSISQYKFNTVTYNYRSVV